MNKKTFRSFAAALAAAVTVSSGIPSVMTANAATAWTDSIKGSFSDGLTLCEDTISNNKYAITVSYDKNDEDYIQYYYDPTRNIMVTSSVTDRLPKNRESIVRRSDTDNDLVKAHRRDFDLMMYNAQRAHDFFEDLGYSGYSRMGDTNIYLGIINSGRISMNTNPVNNATSMNGYLRFGMGDQTDYCCLARGYDVVAHEYTHMVTQHKLGWDTYNTSDETMAIMEAYSDIMAELGEDIPNWKIGTDVSLANVRNKNEEKCVRNIADPSKTRIQSISGDTKEYYSDYASYLDAKKSIIPGQGSTVISHAAYLMYTGTKSGSIPKNDLAKLWYTSIDMYKEMPIDPQEATFPDVKTALNRANEKVFNGNSRYKNIISEAFEDVGITGYAAYSRMTDPTKQQPMSWFLEGARRRFQDGSLWQYYSRSGVMPYDSGTDDGGPLCDHSKGADYCASVSVCAMVGNDFKKFDYYSEEPYSQCAGFARLLQIEYFKTTKFLRLTKYGLYEPRVGDHIRYDNLMGSEHSIFVTAVEKKSFDEYRITYADCNGGSRDCEINWYKQATLRSDYDGLYFTIRDSRNNSERKAYVQWIERPIQIGDANGDSYVNELDFAVLSNLYYYYDNHNDPDVDIAMRDAVCDVNGDGNIDMDDFKTLSDIRTQRYNTYFKTHGYLK